MYKLGLIFSLLLVLSGCASSPESVANFSNKQLGAKYNAQLAIGYLKQGDTVRAREKLNKAVTAAPELPIVQYSLGYFLEHAGDIPAAEQAFRKAVNLNPKSGEAHNNYGAFLCRQQRYAESEREFLLAIEDRFYAGTPKAYENAGLCALEANERDKAYGYFTRAFRQQPDLPNTLLELADLEFQRGNYQQTLFYLQRYRQHNKLSARALWLGVRAADRAGNKDVAASFALTMRHEFATTKEYALMQEYLKKS